MRKYLTMVVLLFMSISMFAQQHSVKGTVVDQNGVPVIGMTVMEQGTQNGTTTDIDGNWHLIVSSGDALLEFTALGYATVTEEVNSRSVINVTAEEEAMLLDAVVAIGYGSVRKKDLTTAVSTVSNEDMKLRPVTEASGFIQGKVAGVTVQQTSGQPGSGMTIRVRGASSIASSNDPLYVVDGVPVGTGSYANSYLSPQDIESMQILKDASSAAIYGSRAANGVVLITTKSGKKSKGPQVNFSAYMGLQNVKRSYEVLNVDQYRELMSELKGAPVVPADVTDQTDWFAETYKTGVNQNYQLSVSNATDKMKYYVGVGYSDEDGVLESTYNKRLNTKMNVETDLYKWLTVGTNLAYSHYRSNGMISGEGSGRAGVVLSVINTPTYAKVWDENNPNHYWKQFYGANVTTPAENLARTENNYTQTDRLLLTGYAQINFTKDLYFKSTVSMDRRWVHNYSFLDPVSTSYGRDTIHGSAASERSDDMRSVYDNILTYNHTWDAKHNFEAMAGTSATTSRWENLWGERTYFSQENYDAIFGLNGGNKAGARGNSQGLSRWAIMSYLARASYNFDSKYYLTVNFRADGSSKLAPGNRWGYFPSASVAWRISGEDFMKDITWIDDLKIRAGWGQQGNQSGLGDYAWVQQYDTSYYDWTICAECNKNHPEKVKWPTATPTVGGRKNIGNKELTWETTTQTNVGIDWSMFNGRLNVTMDGYYKYTKDLLMYVPLPDPNPDIYRNEGEMSNWGLELAVSSVNFDKKDFTWTTDFNISMNRNRLEKLTFKQVYYYSQTSELFSDYCVRMTPGESLSKFWGYTALGVDPETGMVVYEDYNNDGRISNADKHYIGNANPLFTAGMTNTLTWKGLSLSILMTSSVGNDIYNASKIDMIGMMDGKNQITDVLRRWRIPGQITDITKSGEVENLKTSTRWLEDGSYLKIKNITLSYNITHPALKKANISRIQPYVTLDNMITFTKYSGYDPEMSQYSSATNMGIDWGTYPCVRSVVFGVNIDF